MENKAIYIHGTAPSEQERLRLLNRLTNPPFIEFLNINQRIKILDVGCGLGILASEIAERYPNCEITGIEYSQNQLDQAPKDISNLNFMQGDAHHLPFEDETFDLVYCRYLLEHVQEPLRVLQEMRRVLKVGGQAFTQENNIEITVYYPECSKFEAIWKRFIDFQEQLGGDGLIGKKLYALMKRAGFGQVHLSIAPQVHGFEEVNFDAWVKNIIGNVESARDKFIEQGVATSIEIDEAVEELDDFRQNEEASSIFYWNRAVGIK